MCTWILQLAEARQTCRKVPDALICPITCTVFEDPVICADGHTYERVQITSWLQNHDTSPKTNELLPSTMLIPNIQVRQLVAEYKQQDATVDPELTPEQHLNGCITDLMLNLAYPPDGDLLCNATSEQIKAIWKAVRKAKCWSPFCSRYAGKKHSLENLVALLLEGTRSTTGDGSREEAELRDRRLALCKYSGSAGILPQVLLSSLCWQNHQLTHI